MFSAERHLIPRRVSHTLTDGKKKLLKNTNEETQASAFDTVSQVQGQPQCGKRKKAGDILWSEMDSGKPGENPWWGLLDDL